MKIKVCGMREPDNIKELLSLPIDFIGFIFYEASPRNAGKAGLLLKWLQKEKPDFGAIHKVGVFVNAEIEQILNAVHDYELDYIQLHGNESPEYCLELLNYWDMTSMRRAKIIKSFSVDHSFDFSITRPFEGLCPLFLFDTKSSLHGGSGKKFDWALLKAYHGITPFLLSGGIDEHSAAAIRELNLPQLVGVDINSRFEIEAGRKDNSKINDFLKLLNN